MVQSCIMENRQKVNILVPVYKDRRPKNTLSLAQKKLNFAWLSKYKNSICYHVLTTKMAPPGGEI